VAGEVVGGAERGAFDIAEMLRDDGASVAVLALDDRATLLRAWRLVVDELDGLARRFFSRYAGDRELRRRVGAANAATTRSRAGAVDVRTAWTKLLSDALGHR
jgi:hypothetical protein